MAASTKEALGPFPIPERPVSLGLHGGKGVCGGFLFSTGLPNFAFFPPPLPRPLPCAGLPCLDSLWQQVRGTIPLQADQGHRHWSLWGGCVSLRGGGRGSGADFKATARPAGSAGTVAS